MDYANPEALVGTEWMAENLDVPGVRVIDATCPLVTKVHLEAVRYAKKGYTIILIGHRNHVEVEGTMGEAPDCVEHFVDMGDLVVRDAHFCEPMVSSNLIDSPHPQASTTFGLRNLNPLSRSEVS